MFDLILKGGRVLDGAGNRNVCAPPGGADSPSWGLSYASAGRAVPSIGLAVGLAASDDAEPLAAEVAAAVGELLLRGAAAELAPERHAPARSPLPLVAQGTRDTASGTDMERPLDCCEEEDGQRDPTPRSRSGRVAK